jgi:hypothetical protein
VGGWTGKGKDGRREEGDGKAQSEGLRMGCILESGEGLRHEERRWILCSAVPKPDATLDSGEKVEEREREDDGASQESKRGD